MDGANNNMRKYKQLLIIHRRSLGSIFLMMGIIIIVFISAKRLTEPDGM
jgi:hypothetical protein